MWLQDIKGFCARYNLDNEQALFLKCTAEHLVARAEGGLNSDENIVAACHYCNQKRHENDDALKPGKFQKVARAELGAGRWHGLQLCVKMPG